MTTKMKKLIAGNWKMNCLSEEAEDLAGEICDALADKHELLEYNDFVICPPHIHLYRVAKLVDDTNAPIEVGAQDCATHTFGAYTGETSAAMIHDLAVDYVILGHSERRTRHSETNEVVSMKAELAHENKLIAIICVGETETEREAGKEKEVVAEQLKHSVPVGSNAENTVIAYEPVWAIGTGKTATPEDVREMHEFIREKLKEKLADSDQVRILYGGSVKPANAAELFAVPNVDGALIGGASLKADDYLAIAGAALEIAKAA